MSDALDRKIGIVGMGFVGGSIYKGFNTYCDVRGFDVDDSRCIDSFKEVCTSDFIFVALPTPMESVDGGKCDTGLIEQAVADITEHEAYSGGVIVIKSTVPPGTTLRIIGQTDNYNVVHSPEFLTERAALSDFLTPARHIIGGASFEAMDKLRDLYEARFPGVNCHLMNPTSAELVKYACNCFFATKVMYFNELYDIAKAVGADWPSVLEGMMADGRIGHSHNQVPGHDGSRGYGQKCLPKDINALIGRSTECGHIPHLLKEVWAGNLRVRANRDWADIKGAVVAG